MSSVIIEILLKISEMQRTTGKIVTILSYKFHVFALFVSGFVYCAAKLESVGNCEESSIMILSRNLETACCISRHSLQNLQYEVFRVFGCQSEDKFIFILMKTKHPVHIRAFEVVTSKIDVMHPFTKLHLVVRLHFWRSWGCGVPFNCHYSQVYPDTDC